VSGAHALFAPSSAHRVSTCPGSLNACRNLPDEPSFPAVEGTVAHFIHEQCLLSGIPATNFKGMRPRAFMDASELTPAEWALLPDSRGLRDDDFYADEEMVDAVQQSVDWCSILPGEHYVEQRLDITAWCPPVYNAAGEQEKQFGTSDHFVILSKRVPYLDHHWEAGTLVITDYKHGKGVKVYAERNEQAVEYAVGVLEAWDWLYAFDKVVVRIAQPRLDHFDVWETTADEIRAIGRYILERYTLAVQPDAPFHPDEKACKFCKHKPNCKALAQRSQELVLGMFDDLTQDVDLAAPAKSWPLSAPDVVGMTEEELAAVLAHRNLISDFLEACEARATNMLLHGQPVPGYKLVEGRSSRMIRDRDGYEGYLREHKVEPFKPAELITITEAEKTLGSKKKAGLAAYLDKPRGKPTLAVASDKREAYTVTADAMFDAISDDNDL
jgi:hypothetical protein